MESLFIKSLISDWMIDNKPSIKSTPPPPLGTYDLLLGFLIVFLAIAYALTNLYLYKHINE